MAQKETPNPEQLPLGTVVREAFGSAGDKLLTVIGEAVGASGKVTDDLATDLAVDPGQFSRALRGRGIHFSVRWLPAIIYRDRERILVRHLCHLAGGEFVERPRLTPEQRLERLEKTLREAGTFGDAVLRAAYGEEVAP
jgi:hypothetical protein